MQCIRIKAGFPLGGILRAERNFSLSFLISSTREITRQRKIPLRALSPPQRLLKNMKFEGIEIALEGIWYEDNR